MIDEAEGVGRAKSRGMSFESDWAVDRLGEIPGRYPSTGGASKLVGTGG